MKISSLVLFVLSVLVFPAYGSFHDSLSPILNEPLSGVNPDTVTGTGEFPVEDFPLDDYDVEAEPRDTLPSTLDSVVTDTTTLLYFIENYDLTHRIIHPRPARVLKPDEELDYPTMSPLFMPLIFNAQRRTFRLEPRHEGLNIAFRSTLMDSLIVQNRSRRYVQRLARDILSNAEVQQIGTIRYDSKVLPQNERLVYQLDSKRPATWVRPELPKLSNSNPDTKSLPKAKVNPWTTYGYGKFQFSQTYNSPNWSKGGESNMAGLMTLYYEANYTNAKNLAFDNYVEAKVGMNTVSSDSLRNLNVSVDQLKAVTKLGLRMYNDWYYSFSGEFSTQFLNNYKANTWTLKSAFLSPAKLFLGVGIDYKKSNKKKGYNLSVLVTPLTLKMNYVDNIDGINETSYGIEEGRHFGSEIGSKITANLSWVLSEQVRWNSKFYYYTDFTYVDTEWENTIDLNFNNYFTTSFFLHLKLDDRLERDPGQSLLQMQELISFGMMYRW